MLEGKLHSLRVEGAQEARVARALGSNSCARSFVLFFCLQRDPHGYTVCTPFKLEALYYICICIYVCIYIYTLLYLYYRVVACSTKRLGPAVAGHEVPPCISFAFRIEWNWGRGGMSLGFRCIRPPLLLVGWSPRRGLCASGIKGGVVCIRLVRVTWHTLVTWAHSPKFREDGAHSAADPGH